MASAALIDAGADPEALRSSVATLPLDPVDLDRGLSGTKGTVWRYAAIDVGSAHCWAKLHVTPRNPSARWTSQLARDLARRGWRLEAVMSDNASEFRSAEFERAVARLGASHLFTRAGRPQTNGVVERFR
ncbi:MAG: hypothetical protein ACRD02_12920, partial [Acidimicrobiia bacterium]